ncbi:hypothetical protein SCOR_05610 [Sulfidibacter corallicola]|uniref:Acyloxyacyl hydrolase n=1 Tax=Sulfidibacter corallicola TaxID=2818388 RepID=A0A8A4TP46_SULCO|nr:hypothetical protein [Sulfidibacter corallicola]QTD51749.1 hypothetical protein J3U87_04705 [Sulfidibacter corallicola]
MLKRVLIQGWLVLLLGLGGSTAALAQLDAGADGGSQKESGLAGSRARHVFQFGLYRDAAVNFDLGFPRGEQGMRPSLSLVHANGFDSRSTYVLAKIDVRRPGRRLVFGFGVGGYNQKVDARKSLFGRPKPEESHSGIALEATLSWLSGSERFVGRIGVSGKDKEDDFSLAPIVQWGIRF